MKKIKLLFGLLLLLVAGRSSGQLLVCNDLVYVSLAENCMYSLAPEEVLEGIIFSDCIVQVDKVAPFGNGPWVAADFGSADIGKTYQVRVRHVPSGNMCWGNVTIEDKTPPVLSCNGLSIVELDGANQATIATSSLSLSGSDNCGGVNFSPATIQFFCNNHGVSTLFFNASDNSGNTATCLHTVLVNSQSSCFSCVAECPQSVTVSYNEGHTNLLAAFQNSDWSAFEPFGNALFNDVCAYSDSTYTVDYVVGTAGQSWFLRHWEWANGVGQPTDCEQYIVFPTTHTVTVQGKVFLDANNDCIADAGEQGIQNFDLLLTQSPSGTTQTIHPDANGNYFATIVFDNQDDAAELNLLLPPGVNTVCPNAFIIPNSTAIPVHQFDIGLQTGGDCPVMEVDLGSMFTRRCSPSSFEVNYCNNGLDTAFAAYVTLDLDPLLHFVSADFPYTVDGPDSVYTFQLGDVPPLYCGTIVVQAQVSCDAMLGQTLCSQASIYPNTPCSGAWPEALVEASANCTGDSVSLTLKNKGIQDMSAPLDYIVVEDFIMYKQGSFQLNAGDSIVIKTEANGSTWRIESAQVPGYTTPELVAAAIEGCGGTNTPGVLNIYGQDNSTLFYDEYCSQVVGSFDPNDKTAVPVGYSDQHIIRANGVIDYKIRFQNTGTDTAFRVVVVDTLTALLDAKSLEVGASSHPYRLEIYPGGILHFVFDPIVLPDSNINEVASHGYVHFRIAQQKDLPDGTLIENKAAIYFDQNDPVITNTAFHTIGYPFIPNPPIEYNTQIVQPLCSGEANGAIHVSVTGGIPPYSFAWSDTTLQGDALSGLPAGIYQVTFTDSYRGEFVQTFELLAPLPVVVSLDATPAIGNDSNGSASVAATGGTGAFTYLWSNGAATASISGLSPGVYTVSVTDANGCSQSDAVSVLQSISSASEPNMLSQIRVWPNPAHDQVVLDLREALPQLLRLDMAGMDGRVLQRLYPKDLKPMLALSLEKAPPGTFLFLVFHGSDGSVVTEKIVVE